MTRLDPYCEDALIVVDLQHDFLPGGALAVAGGDELPDRINALARGFANVVITQDWHPEGHSSFASSHPGAAPFSRLGLPYGEQTLWPDHCVQGTRGAALHENVDLDRAFLLIRKGVSPDVDSYSAFAEADGRDTGLAPLLRARGVKRVFLCGLATDFCVAFSALDAAKAGFETIVIEDVCRAIDTEGSLERAFAGMAAAGFDASGWTRFELSLVVNPGLTASAPRRVKRPWRLMISLYHHPFCPHSRFVRLALAEYGLEPELIEERPWERRREFLLLNAEGETPVLIDRQEPAVPGAGVIAEFLDDTRGGQAGERRLMPEDSRGRVETRRLMRWFNEKFYLEVSRWLVTEKIFKRFLSAGQGGGAPDMNAVRAARANIRYHMRYIGHLIGARNWLAGDRLSYADLAAAAHLSCVDYLGDAAWEENETAKSWYARVKSRPSFRPLLVERLPGLPPSPTYADLDF